MRTSSMGCLPWQPSVAIEATHTHTAMNIHKVKGREVHTIFMPFSIKHISIRGREIHFISINAVSIIHI